ncbi:oligosaccharide flippase family protein [Paenibacillus sp. GCM10012306]|uniref:oligosaccharide flippase family protein n=1 Tax=Paenibacillus sp. GCM10012306 TaxID=3317342 RepID=UPI003622F118
MPHLFKQSAIRAAAMVAVKIFGLAGRIILTRIAGAEGIGLYQIAYSFYGFILMLAGGLPTALALETARKPAQGWQLLKIISVLLMFGGGAVSLAVFRYSPFLSTLLGNPGLEHALHSLAPALFAAPLLGLLRGYLQGLGRIGIIAISEVTEQAFRVTCMVLITAQLLPLGMGQAVGGGLYGTFLGAFISFSLLTIYLSLDTHSPRPQGRSEVLPVTLFFKTSLVISVTRMFIPASEFIDALLVPSRLLAAGYSTSEATAMYGVIYGMAAIVVYSPSLITGALSHTLTVRIAAEWQQGTLEKFNRLASLALKISWLWGIASGLFLFIHADKLSMLIFNTTAATIPIKYLASIPLLVGFRELTTSILWAQDVKKAPFWGLLSGLACSTFAQYMLVGIPGFGYAGAAIAIISMELVSSLWNLKALHIHWGRLHRTLLLMLCDIGFLFMTAAGLSRCRPLLQGLFSELWVFLLESSLFFLASGLYIYLRCFYSGKFRRS